MRFVSLLMMSAMAAAGADPSDWSRVTGLSPGARLEVMHDGMKKSKGTFVAASADSLTLETDTGPRTLGQLEVTRVMLLPQNRTKRTLIGLALGAGAGAAIFAAGAGAGDIDIRRDLVVGAGALAGAGVGAAVGAATAVPKVIYRKPGA